MNDTTELPDAIRLPLHRLWADAGYLIGRARQETDPERFVTIIKSRCEEIEAAYRADRAERAAPAVTDAMITAYLTANDDYWRKADNLPFGDRDPSRWRNGTPKEATRASLEAALAVAFPSSGAEGS